jgi:hypothetical protein
MAHLGRQVFDFVARSYRSRGSHRRRVAGWSRVHCNHSTFHRTWGVSCRATAQPAGQSGAQVDRGPTSSRNGEVMERQLGLPDDSGLMFAARITFAHGSLRRGQERVMTKKMLLAGVAVAAPSVVSATAAAAQAPRAGVTVLQNEPGGYLAIYQYRFETLAANGDSVEIRGKCLSACTLVLAYIPRERLCFHETAWLGFHHASLSNGAVNEPTMRET